VRRRLSILIARIDPAGRQGEWVAVIYHRHPDSSLGEVPGREHPCI